MFYSYAPVVCCYSIIYNIMPIIRFPLSRPTRKRSHFFNNNKNNTLKIFVFLYARITYISDDDVVIIILYVVRDSMIVPVRTAHVYAFSIIIMCMRMYTYLLRNGRPPRTCSTPPSVISTIPSPQK